MEHSGVRGQGCLSIDGQFCGPPRSANGGYTCGRLANYVAGPATVRLMKPPPLDQPLDVAETPEGVELRTGEEVIARAWPGGPDIEVRPAPPLASARARRNHYAGREEAAFPTCFVCGIARQEGDGLCIYAGPDVDAEAAEKHVACTWTPHPSFCDESGVLPEHLVWAALDCPSGWAFLSWDDTVGLLGEFSAHVAAPIHCGREYIVAGWEFGREGRKRLTASAIYSAEGDALAWARATWIVVDKAFTGAA